MNKSMFHPVCSRAVLAAVLLGAGVSCDSAGGKAELQRLQAERAEVQRQVEAVTHEHAELAAGVQQLTAEGAGDPRMLEKRREQEKRTADLNAKLKKVSAGLKQETDALTAQHQTWRRKAAVR